MSEPGEETSEVSSKLSLQELAQLVGEEIGVSSWITLDQPRIDAFAGCTEDHQWIHVDPARAAVELPSKNTIAHGFLTLSLLSTLIRESIRFTGLRMAINYGLNRVRFVSPVPSGSRIRALITLQAVDAVGDGVQVTWLATIERDGSEKPAAVAEWLVRYYPE